MYKEELIKLFKQGTLTGLPSTIIFLIFIVLYFQTKVDKNIIKQRETELNTMKQKIFNGLNLPDGTPSPLIDNDPGVLKINAELQQLKSKSDKADTYLYISIAFLVVIIISFVIAFKNKE